MFPAKFIGNRKIRALNGLTFNTIYVGMKLRMRKTLRCQRGTNSRRFNANQLYSIMDHIFL